MFLIGAKLIHVNDDRKDFEQDGMKPELFTLRTVPECSCPD